MKVIIISLDQQHTLVIFRILFIPIYAQWLILREESFLSHVERVRSEIKTKFLRAHKILQEREADLLAELQRLVDEYTGDGIIQQIQQLSVSKDALRDTLKGNENKEFLNQSLALIDVRIKEIETNLQRAKDTYKGVSFEWNVELDEKLSVAGDIRLNAVKEGIRNYKEIGEPVLVFGKYSKEGSSPGVFGYLNGIAIHPENNSIYICDGGYNRVQVYNKSFEFVFQFNEKLKFPAGICIKQNKVYVTQFDSHCLNLYNAEGKYLRSVGMKGKKKLEFHGPNGLDISTDRDRIYISEFNNDRVQCLNLNLKFNSFIEDIFGASDVKLTSNEIVVLSVHNPCVSLYTYSHQLIREMIPIGEGYPVIIPFFLILDEASNILITDIRSNCVSVFSFGGELIHRFGREGVERGEFKRPRGIAIDSQGRIIVSSMGPNHCIQIF